MENAFKTISKYALISFGQLSKMNFASKQVFDDLGKQYQTFTNVFLMVFLSICFFFNSVYDT